MTEKYKPEIGQNCEVFVRSPVLGDKWCLVKCVGHDAEGIIWRNGSDTLCYRYADLDDVREYKSVYERYSEELTDLFEGNHHTYYNLNYSDYKEVIKLLWENGYRKVEG